MPIANALSLVLFILSLLTALRTFYLCLRAAESNHRLFILGLSLGLLSLALLANTISETIPYFLVNLNWFRYIAQDVSFLFILLSIATSNEHNLRSLIRWELLFFVLLLLLLIPLLPQDFPYPAVVKTVLSGFSFLCCLTTFFFYLVAFMQKESVFTLCMSSAFCLFSFGYSLNIFGYITSGYSLLNQVGSGLSLGGVLCLLLAVCFVP